MTAKTNILHQIIKKFMFLLIATKKKKKNIIDNLLRIKLTRKLINRQFIDLSILLAQYGEETVDVNHQIGDEIS